MPPSLSSRPRRYPLRQRKRRREWSETTPRPSRSHLDVLTDAAMENVIRFLSRKPRIREWAYFVPCDSVLSVIGAGGSMGSVAKGMFTHLHIFGDCRSFDRFLWPYELRHASRTGTSVPLGDSREVFARLETHVAKMSVSGAWLSKLCASIFASGAAGLRHLSLELAGKDPGCLSAVLASCGRGLEVLELEVGILCKEEVAAVANHCRALRRVVVHCPSGSSCLAPIWRAVGSCLEDVTVCVGNFGGNWGTNEISSEVDVLALPVLSQKCCSVSRICLESFTASKAIASAEALCISYGAGLRDLVLRRCNWDASTLQRIVGACPNVKFFFEYYGIRELPVRQMTAAGPHASAIAIRNGDNGERWTAEQLGEIGRACPNVREYKIRFSSLRSLHFAPLFEKSNHMLLKAHVDVRDGVTGVEIFKALAEKVTTLVDFKYQGRCPPISVIRDFVSVNKGLERISHIGDDVCTCSRGEWEEPYSTEFISNQAAVLSAYLASPFIQSFQGFCGDNRDVFMQREEREKVAEICLPLRTRDVPVSVSVCDCQYL